LEDLFSRHCPGAQLFLLGSHFQSYRQFQADCQTGQLPAYSFIEPQYFADFGHPENDQHPPSVVTLGEQLIADVYNCLRSSKVSRKTLLLITYDEHGGCYDHVAPSARVPPEPPVPGQTFGFDRYGVRVPAVIVSPYVAPGTIFGKSSAVPFDHTAIIATVRKRFGISEALTARDAQAPDLDSVLTLPRPTNLGPLRLKALPYAPTPATAAVTQTKPLNSMKKALVGLARQKERPPRGGLSEIRSGVLTWRLRCPLYFFQLFGCGPITAVRSGTEPGNLVMSRNAALRRQLVNKSWQNFRQLRSHVLFRQT
jgi:phospholipase C